MLVEFSVKNFRSINELQTISFAPTGLKSAEKYKEIDEGNITNVDGFKSFKTIGIYGANASGKSNIVKALDSFIKAITQEASSNSNLDSLCDPFKFQDDFEFTESYFQLVLIIDGKKYRYGLTAKKKPIEKEDSSKGNEVVTNEWLFGTKEKNMSELFIRTGIEVKNDLLPNKEKIPRILPYGHTLFLTFASAFDKEGVCQKIREYLSNWTISNLNSEHEKFRQMSVNIILGKRRREDFLYIMSSFGLKYSGVQLEDEEELLRTGNKNVPQNKITLQKECKINGDINYRDLNLFYNESVGTQKLFDLAGLLLLTFGFKKPAFLTLDEIDSNFHPSLLIKLIKMFNNPEINKSNSQLLFTSHDTNLMSPSIMRRDQFYLAEKNENESTRFYSLADLKGIRNDADFAKQYLAGYYGALPILEEYT
ncbi:MAG: ATP-binding protein [Flavobacteriaceae bacterium]